MAPMPPDEVPSERTADSEAVRAGGCGPTFVGRTTTPTASRTRMTTAPISTIGAKRLALGNPQRREACEVSARTCTSLHKSGAGIRSRLRNRLRRSLISITQDLPEPLPSAAEVCSYGELRHSG